MVRRTTPVTTSAVLLAVTAMLAAACSRGPDTPPAGKAINPTTTTCPSTSTVQSVAGRNQENRPGGAAGILLETTAFLNTLDDKQRTAVMVERTQSTLTQWSNLPENLVKRTGLRMDRLSRQQREAAMAILKAALSPEGFAQVQQISTADGILASFEDPALGFGTDHYWIRILGTPADTGKWTIQYDGHHLGLNITVDGANVTLGPSFWGAQPASYEQAGTAAEPLCGETVKAFAVMGALDTEQRRRATLTAPIKNIVLGLGMDGRTLAPEGIPASALNADQKALLLDLVHEWISHLNATSAASKLTAARENLDQVWFAWYGEATIGNPVYYRITAPTFLIEFAHQQGEGRFGGGITHIHSIYREPGNDYGGLSGS